MTQKFLEELKGKSVRFFTKIRGISSKVEGRADYEEVSIKTKQGESKRVKVLVIHDALVNNSFGGSILKFTYNETKHIESVIIKGGVSR